MSPDELLVVEEAERLVRPGFTTLDEARAAIIEYVEDDDEVPVTAERAEAIVNDVWARRKAEERSWSGLSDADRVAAAFAELEASGVVARMSFTCCQNCGAHEIVDGVPPGVSPRGYVFFHQQDAERLGEPDAALYLSYGVFPQRDVTAEECQAEALAVGNLVTHTLVANGLRVDWDGTLAKRIHVVDLDWRRRLPD